jgi:hypothetical protein
MALVQVSTATRESYSLLRSYHVVCLPPCLGLRFATEFGVVDVIEATNYQNRSPSAPVRTKEVAGSFHEHH